MNSSFINVGQLKVCSKSAQHLKTQNMEIPNHNSDIVFDEDFYTITWTDIKNAEIDHENHLDDIENFFRENFFREDFENDVLEEDVIDKNFKLIKTRQVLSLLNITFEV